jgi:hypothetical protein
MTQTGSRTIPRPRFWILIAPVFVLALTAAVLLSIVGLGSWMEKRDFHPKTLAEYQAQAAREAGVGNTRAVVLQGQVAMQGDWAHAVHGWDEHQMIRDGKALDSLVLDDETGEVVVYYDPELLSAAPQMGTKLEIRARTATSESPDLFQGLVAESIELIR